MTSSKLPVVSNGFRRETEISNIADISSTSVVSEVLLGCFATRFNCACFTAIFVVRLKSGRLINTFDCNLNGGNRIL